MIAQKISRIEAKKGFKLIENSIEECIKAYDHFQSITRTDGKKSWFQRQGEDGPTQFQFTEREAEWIRNEMYMCACSFVYWFYRYFFLKTKEGRIQRPEIFIAQQIYLDILAEIDLAGLPIILMILKARQLGMCLRPDTKVLTADLKWIPIDDVQVGQELVAVDEGDTREQLNANRAEYARDWKTGKKRVRQDENRASRKMRTTSVLARREVNAPAIKITMDDGRVLVATGEHKFLSKDRGGCTPKWMPVKEMKIGDEIRYVTQPWQETTVEDSWFGGLIDGEGSLSDKSAGSEVNVSQKFNRVYERAKRYLDQRGYSYREEPDLRKNLGKLCVSRMDEMFRLIGSTRPVRFIGRRWWEGKELPGKKSGTGWAKIVSMELLPSERMIDIQTTDKTFIAEGCVSHNSTVTEAVILWIAIFRRGCHTVIASAEEQKSVEMSEMVWVALEYMPLWMQPTLTREDRKLGPEFGLTNSDILIQHGAMTKGISRGSTPIAAHISEVAYYPNPVETIESSLIRAMHENPRTFLVLESTARKKGDWWHRTWDKNRAGEAEGYNRFTLLFLPWYVGRDKYPTADFIRNHPIPDGWTPRRETIKQAQEARLYVATTPLLKKYLGAGWEMPREQMWFWEFNYVEASREDSTLKSFYAEMAADERSCYQSKRWSAFTFEVLDKLESHGSRKHVTYAMTGDGIEEKFWLRQHWSHSSNRVEIPWIAMSGKQFNWKLVPLKQVPTSEKDQFFLNVWEAPKPGYNYTIGIDISAGIGQDRTVIDVLRVGRDYAPDVQVAQLCSPWISAADSPPFANALGIWYGQHMSPTPEALMCPEVQIAVGDLISHQLSLLGYSNFFYMKRYDQRKHPGQKPTRRGFASVPWAKSMKDISFNQAIEAGWIIINSEETLDELKNLEAEESDSGKPRFDHAEGENNDCYTAGSIAYFCSHDEQTLTERLQGKVKPKKVQELKADEVTMDSTEMMLARHFQKEERSDLNLDEDNEDFTNMVY